MANDRARALTRRARGRISWKIVSLVVGLLSLSLLAILMKRLIGARRNETASLATGASTPQVLTSFRHKVGYQTLRRGPVWMTAGS